jgi:hypothetical protein
MIAVGETDVQMPADFGKGKRALIDHCLSMFLWI